MNPTPSPEGAHTPLPWPDLLTILCNRMMDTGAQNDYIAGDTEAAKRYSEAWNKSNDARKAVDEQHAALTARVAELEGALEQTVERCARVEIGAPSYYLANDLANVLRATLTRPPQR